EGLEELNLLVWEESGLGSRNDNCADGDTVAQHRDCHVAAGGDDLRDRAMPVLRVRVEIWDVFDGATVDRPGRPTAPARRHGTAALHCLDALGPEPIVGYEVEKLPVEPKEVAELSLAESPRALRDRVEHRLDVRRRAGDHPQDLAGRGLLLERLLGLV